MARLWQKARRQLSHEDRRFLQGGRKRVLEPTAHGSGVLAVPYFLTLVEKREGIAWESPLKLFTNPHVICLLSICDILHKKIRIFRSWRFVSLWEVSSPSVTWLMGYGTWWAQKEWVDPLPSRLSSTLNLRSPAPSVSRCRKTHRSLSGSGMRFAAPSRRVSPLPWGRTWSAYQADGQGCAPSLSQAQMWPEPRILFVSTIKNESN